MWRVKTLDWETKKKQLLRSFFVGLSDELSPDTENVPVSAPSPDHSLLGRSTGVEASRCQSPLPSLIIERESKRRSYYDKSDEFYGKLKINVEKYIARLKRGEPSDYYSDLSSTEYVENIENLNKSNSEIEIMRDIVIQRNSAHDSFGENPIEQEKSNNNSDIAFQVRTSFSMPPQESDSEEVFDNKTLLGETHYEFTMSGVHRSSTPISENKAFKYSCKRVASSNFTDSDCESTPSLLVSETYTSITNIKSVHGNRQHSVEAGKKQSLSVKHVDRKSSSTNNELDNDEKECSEELEEEFEEEHNISSDSMELSPDTENVPVSAPSPDHSPLGRSTGVEAARCQSPLPSLIIERESKRCYDKSDEFYDKLKIKLEKYIARLERGEPSDYYSDLSSTEYVENIQNLNKTNSEEIEIMRDIVIQGSSTHDSFGENPIEQEKSNNNSDIAFQVRTSFSMPPQESETEEVFDNKTLLGETHYEFTMSGVHRSSTPISENKALKDSYKRVASSNFTDSDCESTPSLLVSEIYTSNTNIKSVHGNRQHSVEAGKKQSLSVKHVDRKSSSTNNELDDDEKECSEELEEEFEEEHNISADSMDHETSSTNNKHGHDETQCSEDIEEEIAEEYNISSDSVESTPVTERHVSGQVSAPPPVHSTLGKSTREEDFRGHSPLPILIIEREPKRDLHDEPDESYNKMKIQVEKYIARLERGEPSDDYSDLSSTQYVENIENVNKSNSEELEIMRGNVIHRNKARDSLEENRIEQQKLSTNSDVDFQMRTTFSMPPQESEEICNNNTLLGETHYESTMSGVLRSSTPSSESKTCKTSNKRVLSRDSTNIDCESTPPKFKRVQTKTAAATSDLTIHTGPEIGEEDTRPMLRGKGNPKLYKITLGNYENEIECLPHSQPFLNEKEEKTFMLERKRHNPSSNMEEPQSQSLLAPKRNRTDKSAPCIKRTPVTGSQSKETQKLQENSSQNSEQENQNYNECVVCNKIGNQKDLRNKYYGQLVSSELQFVEPCKRTFVYVEILKLIHKYKYVTHMPPDDMEIK